MAFFALTPTSEAGEHFVARCREVQPRIAALAAEADRQGRFVHESIAELRRAGVLSGSVPTQFGGGGVRSIHDLAVGMYELAQGCASTTIATWMHVGAGHQFTSAWLTLRARGNPDAAERLVPFLRGVGAGEIIFCIAGTEPGSYANHYPMTEARPADRGYRIQGTKIFATISPAATHINVPVRVTGAQDSEPERRAIVTIPAGRQGLTVIDNWDGLGMRGSGSGAVRLEDVFVSAEELVPGDPIGVETRRGLLFELGGGAGLTAAALGVARAARDRAIDAARTRVRLPATTPAAHRPTVQVAVAEMDRALLSATATLRQSLLDIDGVLAQETPARFEIAELREAVAATRLAKLTVDRAAAEVVNRAMTITGGSSFTAGSELARAYRDVRAFPFMAPQEPEIQQYAGKVALGLDPTIDL